jgi:putative DNA primase/helicase
MRPRPLDVVLAAVPGSRRAGGQYLARCPVHEDRRASLAVRELPDGRVLIHCHAGCATLHVLEALRLSFRDLRP